MSDRVDTRVVITGRGVVTAIGDGPAAFWQALVRGTNGVGTLTRTDPAWYRNPRAAEVPLPDPLNADRPDLGRASALLLRVCRAAAAEAGLADLLPARVGVVVGSALLDLRDAEDMLCADAPRAGFVERFSMAATVARDLGLDGHGITFPNACGSGTLAIAVAADLIATGELDAVLAAGADTYTESMLGLADRANLRRPTCVAPFDRKRGGPLLGEGAAALVLERADGARRRGATIFAEVAGAGLSCDARSTHKTCVDGVRAAIRAALQRSGVAPDEVDYVCAHGTATDVNDLAETEALKHELGARARQIPVSAIKSMIGHTSGASGAVALLAALLAIEHRTAPPTINLTDPDPAFDLDFVANRAQPRPIDVALVNGFGFGGSNACVVLRRATGAQP